MASQLNPYLTFDGNAREAMEYYHSLIGGELKVNTFAEFGNSDPAVADKVMHAMLTAPQGWILMASDSAPGFPYVKGTNITVSVSGDPGEGIEELWEKLAEDGSVGVPFEKQMWGDLFGQLTDKFGIQWMLDVLGSDQM